MIILDILKYFAKYPSKDGVLSAFTEGSSEYPEYADLKTYINGLADPVIPELQAYVFGQSYESVKSRIADITGCYLFVDFGEITSLRDSRNSIEDSQKLAVTIAIKVPSTIDTVEECIISDITLQLISRLRTAMLNDDRLGEVPWRQLMSDKHSIVPVDNKEINSIGWSILFDTSASDWFNIKNK